MSAARETAAPEATATVAPWVPQPEGTPLDADILALRRSILHDHPHCGLDFLGWFLSPRNPAGPGFAVTLQREGRLLGLAALTPRQVRLGGRDVLAAFGYDYMVDRAIGSAGSGRYAIRLARIWNRMATEAGYAFCFSYPNARAIGLLLSRHVGWVAVGSPRLFARPLGGPLPGAGLRGLALRAAGAAEDLALAALPRRRAGTVRPLDLADPADRAAIDALWARRRDDTPVSLTRDAANLSWRYADHPVQRYAVAGRFGPEGLAALAVTCRREIEGMPALLVVDALLDPQDLAGNAALAAEALRQGARDGAVIAVAEALPGSTLARTLARAGFLRVPRRLDPKPFVLTLRQGAGDAAPAFAAGNWQFAWGDMDVV